MSSSNTLKLKNNKLNGYTDMEIGDDHLYTGLNTPLKKDAFAISDEEKKNKIIKGDFKITKFIEFIALMASI